MSKKSEEKTASNGPVIDAADEREQIIDPSDIGASKRYRTPTVDEVLAEKENSKSLDDEGPAWAGNFRDEDVEPGPPRLRLQDMECVALLAGGLLQSELMKTGPLTSLAFKEREKLVGASVALAKDLVLECIAQMTDEGKDAGPKKARQQAAS